MEIRFNNIDFSYKLGLRESEVGPARIGKKRYTFQLFGLDLELDRITSLISPMLSSSHEDVEALQLDIERADFQVIDIRHTFLGTCKEFIELVENTTHQTVDNM